MSSLALSNMYFWLIEDTERFQLVKCDFYLCIFFFLLDILYIYIYFETKYFPKKKENYQELMKLASRSYSAISFHLFAEFLPPY